MIDFGDIVIEGVYDPDTSKQTIENEKSNLAKIGYKKIWGPAVYHKGDFKVSQNFIDELGNNTPVMIKNRIRQYLQTLIDDELEMKDGGKNSRSIIGHTVEIGIYTTHIEADGGPVRLPLLIDRDNGSSTHTLSINHTISGFNKIIDIPIMIVMNEELVRSRYGLFFPTLKHEEGHVRDSLSNRRSKKYGRKAAKYFIKQNKELTSNIHGEPLNELIADINAMEESSIQEMIDVLKTIRSNYTLEDQMNAKDHAKRIVGKYAEFMKTRQKEIEKYVNEHPDATKEQIDQLSRNLLNNFIKDLDEYDRDDLVTIYKKEKRVIADLVAYYEKAIPFLKKEIEKLESLSKEIDSDSGEFKNLRSVINFKQDELKKGTDMVPVAKKYLSHFEKYLKEFNQIKYTNDSASNDLIINNLMADIERLYADTRLKRFKELKLTDDIDARIKFLEEYGETIKKMNEQESDVPLYDYLIQYEKVYRQKSTKKFGTKVASIIKELWYRFIRFIKKIWRALKGTPKNPKTVTEYLIDLYSKDPDYIYYEQQCEMFGDDNMIDFGSLLYQESSRSKKSDNTREKYDDKYDLDNGPDTEIETVDVDVDDDFDNYTTDEEDDDKKNDKDKDDDKKKGDKKKKSPLEEDNDGEIEDVEEFSIQESYTMKDISKYGAKEYCDMHYDPSQHDEIIKKTIAGCEAFFKKYFGFDVTEIESKLKGLKFRSNNGEEYKISDTYDPEKIIGVLSAIAIHHMWKESEIEDAKGFDEESIINSIECEDLDVIIGKAKRNLIPYHLFINWKGGEDSNLYIYISKNPAEPSSHCDDINVKDLLKSKGNDEEESYQEASIIKKRHENQDVDTDNESRVNENNYYTQIARNSKDLEHLYKTLLKRADKETIIGELTNLFNELKEMREKYFKSHYELNKSLDPHKSYHGMQKIIEQDMNAIQQNIDKMSDPKEPKLPKTLVKKTIKMMNNLQQDMITECQRSQPFEVRHARDIAKKMWLFESYTEDDYDESEYVQEEVSAKAHLNARQQCINDLHKACDDATSPINTKKMKYNLSDKDISTIRDGADAMREAFDNFIKNSKGTSMEFDLITDHLRAKIERFNRTIDKNLENAKNRGTLSRMGRDQLYNALTGMRDAYSKLMFENLPTAERVAVMATDMFLVKDAKKHMSGIFKESVEDDMFAKIGEMMVHYRKQKELQDLAEKNGVQINGVRYTDDSIMNIVTSVVALMMARNEGDPRYRQLVEQGMRKRSLKVEIINSYKDRANELINQYDHGPIVGATPVGNTIEIVSDEDVPVEEFYIDENGEMQSTYYQEADEDDSDDNEKDEEIDDDDDADEEDDLDESDSEEEDAKDDDDEESKDDDEDDEEEDEDIEEFYIDENGEMQSSWYNESETTETVTKPVRQRNDEEQSWEFRPGRKIGPIEFGMTRDKAHTAVSSRYGEPKPQSDTKDFSSAETYGNKFSVYYDASQKVCAVEVNNNIVVEMDRSIIFPGDPTNIKKKALDLQPDKTNPERGLTSRIMGISIILDPSNKMKSILFTRKGFIQEKEFKKFDKVSEMMNGDDETSAIRKMKEIYKFLDKHHVISDKGKAAMKHIDKDTVITSNELTMHGCEFMVKYYDQVRGSDYKTIRNELEEKWNQFNQSN